MVDLRRLYKKIMGKVKEMECPRIDESIPEGWRYETLGRYEEVNEHGDWHSAWKPVELTGRWKVISYPGRYSVEVECECVTSGGSQTFWTPDVEICVLPNESINKCNCVGA